MLTRRELLWLGAAGIAANGQRSARPIELQAGSLTMVFEPVTGFLR